MTATDTATLNDMHSELEIYDILVEQLIYRYHPCIKNVKQFPKRNQNVPMHENATPKIVDCVVYRDGRPLDPSPKSLGLL